MKKLILSSAVLAMTAGMTLAESHGMVVRIATEGAYPPYNFINDKNEIDGFERKLGDELCKRAGLTCEWVLSAWDPIIPDLQSGNFDVIMAGMSITDERETVIDFTQNYIPPETSAYLALSADVDLKSGPIAAQSKTIQAGYVAEQGMMLVEFPTPDETVAAVKNGEVVAVLADKDFLKPYADQSGGQLVLLAEEVPLGGGVGMGFRDSDDELRAKFDAAIKSMKCDGSLDALIVLPEYFGPEAVVFGDAGKEGC